MEKVRRFITSHVSSIILNTVFIVCSIFICSVSYYMLNLYQIDNNFDGIFSNNTIYFKIDKIKTVDFSVLVNDNSYKDLSVIKKNDENLLSAYEVITLNKKLSLDSGRSFDKNDFNNKQLIAYVGKNTKEIVDVSNLRINDEQYSVIGEFSNDTVKSQNYAIFYTKGNIQNIDTKCSFAMDGNNRLMLKSAYNELVKNIERQGGKVTKLSVNAMSVAAFIFIKADLIKLILLTTLLLVLVIVLVSIFWLYSKKQYIAACMIIGIPRVSLKITKQFILMYLGALVLSYFTTSLFISKKGFSILVFYISAIVGLFISLISIRISIKQFNKQEIRTLLESDYE